MIIERTIIQTLYFSKKLNNIPGKIKATIPAPTVAPQIGAPIVHTCNAPNPNNTLKIPINEAPLLFAEEIFSFIFLTRQVSVSEVKTINNTPKTE